MSIYNNKNLKPMLLEEYKSPFDDKNYIFEIKFDGVRTLIYVEPKNILIKSRNGNILNNTYPELNNIKKIVKDKIIFDGEIVHFDNGFPSFERLQKRFSLKSDDKIKKYMKEIPVKFICFDILYENKDLTMLPLIERKKILDKYPDTDYFEKTKYIEEKGKSLFNKIKKKNLEGIIAKEKNSIYSFGVRTRKWIKIKNIKDDDFFIGAYDNTDNAMCVLIIGKKTNNKLNYIGKVTLGKKTNDYKIINNHKKVKKSPFINFNDEKYIYIKPDLECTIMYTEITKSGSLRHAVYKSLKR